MNKKLLATCCLLLTLYVANAQAPTWQWGKRGGSPDLALTLTDDDEHVVDMQTDQAGNIYVLSQVQQDGFSFVNVDGHTVTGWGDLGESVYNILLTSFTCTGGYRWSKDIGTSQDCYGVALKLDSSGGIYVAGSLNTDYVTDHIDADTSWVSPMTSFKSLFLLKYDTAGHYKWIRMPEPDTTGIWSPGSYVFDMDVDATGNSFMLCRLAPGAFAGGAYVVPSLGVYMLKYDKNGNFISGNPMQISLGVIYPLLHMKKDFQLNRYYLTASNVYGTVMSFGSYPIAHPMCIGCFNDAGTLLWQKQDTYSPAYGYEFGRPALDMQHNIYCATYSTTADTFNGYIVPNYGPFVVKLDTGGNNIWTASAITNAATFCNNITVHGNEADIAGGYPGLLKWPGYPDSLNIAPGPGGYRIFVTRFNASTGAVTGLDSIGSTSGIYNGPTAITADKFGNFYVGGYLQYQMWMPLPGGMDTLTSIGGYSDFFVAKYGTATCSCTGPGTLSFTTSGTKPTTQFIYSGSSAGVDSVLWLFGDGTTGTSFDTYHTYTTPAADSYHVCIVAYTNCGTDTLCREVHLGTTGIANVTNALIKVYPNPASNELYIENATPGTTVRLFNVMGQQVYAGSIASSRQVITTSDLAPGTYLLQLTDISGNRQMRTIVKE